MTARTVLYLARHGQSEWNNHGRVTGRLDPCLSDKGRQQSEALAQCLRGEGLDAIYVSALQRTAQTAEPASSALGVPLRRLPALNEIGMGELEGRFRDERDPAAQMLWAQWKAQPWSFTVPGGEPFTAVVDRVQGALRGLLDRHAGQRLLVVAHSATNRVLLGTLLGWPKARWHEIHPRNKHCYRLCLLDAAAPQVHTITLGGRQSGRREAGFLTGA